MSRENHVRCLFCFIHSQRASVNILRWVKWGGNWMNTGFVNTCCSFNSRHSAHSMIFKHAREKFKPHRFRFLSPRHALLPVQTPSGLAGPRPTPPASSLLTAFPPRTLTDFPPSPLCPSPPHPSPRSSRGLRTQLWAVGATARSLCRRVRAHAT